MGGFLISLFIIRLYLDFTEEVQVAGWKLTIGRFQKTVKESRRLMTAEKLTRNIRLIGYCQIDGGG